MASPQQSATMENLPSDVKSNIFTRLLAKQLAQLRCVSKPWNAFLSQPAFIKSHLRRSINTNDEILMFFDEDFKFDCKPLTTHPSRSPHLEHTNFIEFPANPPFDSKGWSVIGSAPACGSVIGSVNGLICFSYGLSEDLVVHIWNPSLTVILNLPPFKVPFCDESNSIHFGFGFDPKTDDYKVVKFTSRFTCTNFLVGEEWLQVEVYSVRKGSWHLITQRFPPHVFRIRNQDEVCLDGRDGHFHWLCDIDLKKNLQTIISFDFNLETFSEISFPDSLGDPNVHRKNALGDFAGKLCVMSCVKDCDECEVWVMDQYGVAESWVKHHVFSQFNGDISPIGITSTNGLLFEDEPAPLGSELDDAFLYRRLALYDPVAAKVKSIMSTVILRCKFKVVPYVDSLVWVTPVESGSAFTSYSHRYFGKKH